jgi:hypothetical protein
MKNDAKEIRASFRRVPQYPPIGDVDKLSRLPAPSKHKSSRRKAKDKGRDSSSSSDNSSKDSSSESDSDSSSDLQKRKSDKKKKPSRDRKRTKENRRKPRDDDSDSSSSDPSSSSSDESDSSSNRNKSRHRRSNHRQSSVKSKKKRRSRRGKSRGGNYNKYSGPDPSIGDKEYIYKLAVDGREIDVEVGPPDLRSKDSMELFNAAADVTSLPGMLGSSTSMEDTSEDARNTTEMAATLVATAMGRTPRIHDSLWQTAKRHALRQIKDKDTLFSFVKAVGKDEDAAFKKQSSAIRLLMYRRHYSKESVEEYLRNGLLPRLTKECFRCYSSLLQSVRQLAYEHGIWEGGPAKAMLDYHSIRLLQVRRHAISRRGLVLETYVYLRDAEAKAFYHESMAEVLWDKVAELTMMQASVSDNYQGGSDGELKKTPSPSSPRCSHCRNATLHKMLNIESSKKACYFVELFQAKARKAASEAIAEHKESPDKDIRECCRAALIKHRG